MDSGSEVVGAATIAPDGEKTHSFRSRALRRTAWYQGPEYVIADDHLGQKRSVRSNRSSASLRHGRTHGSWCVAARSSSPRVPGRATKRPEIACPYSFGSPQS